MDYYRPRHDMPITHHDLLVYTATTPYIEYAAEGLTGRTRVRRGPGRTAYAIIYSLAPASGRALEGLLDTSFFTPFLRGISCSGALRVIYACFPRKLHPSPSPPPQTSSNSLLLLLGSSGRFRRLT